ncbi:hypothetical protein QL285_015134 [Trifolium repens]|nr:hypothetical protein QL285_015134 [Trifolium repens]
MKKLKQDTYCVTTATTDKIRVSNQGWYFRGCHDCSCKAEGVAPPYVCKKGHNTHEEIIKYKIDVDVTDGNDTAKFVLWDNTLDELLGITASSLLEKQRVRGLDNSAEYPKKLDDLMDKKFAIRSSLKYIETIPIINEIPIAEIESPHTQSFTTSDIEKFACLDDSMLSTPNVSTSADKVLSGSSQKTPAKRIAVKEVPLDSDKLSSQFSSTRGTKLIKKEKI